MGTRTPTVFTGNLTGQVGSLTNMLDSALVSLGWSIEFTGTNRRIYRPSTGTRFRLLVDDNGGTAGGAREAIWRGAESATDINTLVDPFPTVALVADASCVVRKSDTLDATARAYRLVGDSKWAILWVRFGTANADIYFFGDPEARWSGDNYCCLVGNRGASNSITAELTLSGLANSLSISQTSRLWFARTASGGTKVDRAAIMSDKSALGNVNFATMADLPHPETGKIHQSIVNVRSNGSQTDVPSDGVMRRAALPFLWEWEHGQGVTTIVPEDTYTDTAYDASSVFVAQCNTSTTSFANAGGRTVLQTAGTWNPGF